MFNIERPKNTIFINKFHDYENKFCLTPLYLLCNAYGVLFRNGTASSRCFPPLKRVYEFKELNGFVRN